MKDQNHQKQQPSKADPQSVRQQGEPSQQSQRDTPQPPNPIVDVERAVAPEPDDRSNESRDSGDEGNHREGNRRA